MRDTAKSLPEDPAKLRAVSALLMAEVQFDGRGAVADVSKREAES